MIFFSSVTEMRSLLAPPPLHLDCVLHLIFYYNFELKKGNLVFSKPPLLVGDF